MYKELLRRRFCFNIHTHHIADTALLYDTKSLSYTRTYLAINHACKIDIFTK
jgi:hypothetical protein